MINRFKMCNTIHGQMIVNQNDMYIGRSLMIYGEWAYQEIELMKEYILPGNTVVDIGANFGTHTLSFAELVGDEGRVYSFEPQMPIFQIMCANVIFNRYTNIFTYNSAVGEHNSKIKVELLPYDRHLNAGGYNLTYAAGEQLLPTYEVNMITIDSLNLDECHLIKADVEGWEPAVLRGAKKTIAQHRPVLYIENNTEKSKKIIEIMKAYKYNVYIHNSSERRVINFNNIDVAKEECHGTNLNLLGIPVEREQRTDLEQV